MKVDSAQRTKFDSRRTFLWRRASVVPYTHRMILTLCIVLCVPICSLRRYSPKMSENCRRESSMRRRKLKSNQATCVLQSVKCINCFNALNNRRGLQVVSLERRISTTSDEMTRKLAELQSNTKDLKQELQAHATKTEVIEARVQHTKDMVSSPVFNSEHESTLRLRRRYHSIVVGISIPCLSSCSRVVCVFIG